MTERRLLQCTIALCGLVPFAAGLSGIIYGANFLVTDFDISTDSHIRYLSGLLLGIGLGFWSTLAHIEKHTERFLVLTLIVFAGGLARLGSLLTLGCPGKSMQAALVMELVVTPLLCLWQRRIASKTV